MKLAIFIHYSLELFNSFNSLDLFHKFKKGTSQKSALFHVLFITPLVSRFLLVLVNVIAKYESLMLL